MELRDLSAAAAAARSLPFPHPTASKGRGNSLKIQVPSIYGNLLKRGHLLLEGERIIHVSFKFSNVELSADLASKPNPRACHQ